MELPIHQRFCVGLCWQCKQFRSTEQLPLKRCGGCQLVAYCSRDCQKNAWIDHKHVCKEFPVVNGKNVLHTSGHWEAHIGGLLKRAARLPNADVIATPIFLRPWVCNTCHEASRDLLTNCKCSGVSYCSIRCAQSDKPHEKNCTQLSKVVQTIYLTHMRMAYPFSLIHVLQLLPKDNIGRCFLDEMKTLVVHVITSNNLMDSMENRMQSIWEESFTQFIPKLKQLKLVFIMQREREAPFSLNIEMVHPGYEFKGCNITYSFQQMKYHMFFSSENYTRPDVVAIYGNTEEMLSSDEDIAHSRISYRNMTNSRETLLVLMDTTEDLVKQGAKAVNDVQLIEQIIPPMINPSRGCTLKTAFTNEKHSFTCIRKT